MCICTCRLALIVMLCVGYLLTVREKEKNSFERKVSKVLVVKESTRLCVAQPRLLCVCVRACTP